MNWLSAVKQLLPPLLVTALRGIRRRFIPPEYRLEFAPHGWDTRLPPDRGADSPDLVAHERAVCSDIATRPLGSAPFFLPERGWTGSSVQKAAEHGEWVTFAYAFSRARSARTSLRVLDYGSGLGYCYQVACAAVPDAALEYHCKELPGMAAEGRRLNGAITWHTDDACVDAAYDLVIMSSVLQYVRDWEDLVRRITRASPRYILVARTPTVAGATYVAIQRTPLLATHYQVLNRAALLGALHDGGLGLEREFITDVHVRIDGAPEQPRYEACLFKRLGDS